MRERGRGGVRERERKRERKRGGERNRKTVIPLSINNKY